MPRLFFSIIILTFLLSCGNKDTGNKDNTGENKKDYKVTFIQLGSDRCPPCRLMKPILEKVKERYKDQVNLIYYDVWTKEEAHYAEKYNIRVIPTQIFIDESGKEFFRHEGYLSYYDIELILKSKGIN